MKCSWFDLILYAATIILLIALAPKYIETVLKAYSDTSWSF